MKNTNRMNKTEKRVAWIIGHKNEIEASRVKIEAGPRVTVGNNARYYNGMSGGGYGWWAKALKIAGIKCNEMNYWSGSNPTPSTAINAGIANYIYLHAPNELK